MKSQIELAKEKGIEVGDRVRYVEKGKEGGLRLWDRDVTAITGSGVVIDGHDQYIPVQSLEKVVESKPMTIPADWVKRPEPPLTKREYFAAMAMQGLCANAETKYKQVHTIAISIADALIAELNKGEGV